ncbi:uncharacterized protein LOC120076228 [Benincasa hispida]|uniref:uncharacterized protein LOC120076228 n=1 Tax=Benincasa hispida TaxID=102211 RepID=UPI0019000FD4|nr:uncharacterized protein LOC120076228 [Benincasa hispida]
MRQLDGVAPSIRIELEDVGKSKWARAFCRRKRYSLMTTNIFECMNSALKEARELPVIGLLESIRSLVQKWFYKRRSHWSFQYSELSLHAENIIRSALRDSRSIDLYPINQYEFEVHDRSNQFVVNILNRTYSCRWWDLDMIPCSHACIALSRKNLQLQSYVHDFYRVSNLRLLYRKKTRLIGNIQQFTTSHVVGNDPVLPPNVKRPAGRPKKKESHLV